MTIWVKPPATFTRPVAAAKVTFLLACTARLYVQPTALGSKPANRAERGLTVKKLIEVDAKTEGFLSLIGERVTLFCLNYIYTGKLTGVNDTYVLLEDAAIVFETGAFDANAWKDAQTLPYKWHVQLTAIESYGVLK